MAHKQFLLQWSARGGAEITRFGIPVLGNPFARFDRPRYKREPVTDVTAFAEGEDIGIRDWTIPPVSVGQGVLAPGGAIGLPGDISPKILPAIPLPNVRAGGPSGPLPAGDFIPGSIYESQDKTPTDWDKVYEEFVVLNPEIQTGVPDPLEQTITENDMAATDWGDIARSVGGVLDIFGGGSAATSPIGLAPAFAPPAGTVGVPTPSKVTIDTRTGAVTPCRRRRRRRLLTPTDLSDLAALATIVGKGDALKLAVTKAVRR